jgi:hypothetical protein
VKRFGSWDDATCWCSWTTILSRDLIDSLRITERTDRNSCAEAQSQYSKRRKSEPTLHCKRHIESLHKTGSCSRLPFDWLARQFRIGSQRGHHFDTVKLRLTGVAEL